MGAEILVFLGIQAAVFTALFFALKGSADAPLEPNAPPEKPKKVLAYGDEVLARAAERHGLRQQLDVATGKVGELGVTLRAVPHAAVERVGLSFTGEAVFERGLGLEVEVRPHGGDTSDFAEAFEVEALHPDQAKALLGGELGDAFVDAKRRGWSPSLDDSRLAIEVPGQQPADEVDQAFVWLVETARAVLGARRALPRPALEQGVQDAFRAVAEQRGGRVDVGKNELLIETELGTLRAWLERRGKKAFRTVIGIELERSVPADLHLGLERDRSSLARWREPDLSVGQAEIDDTFVVRGESQEAVRAVLGEAARTKLLALVERVDGFELEPARMRLSKDNPLNDAAELLALVDHALAALGALCPSAPRSAYR